jgi:hypothetical protein
MRPTVLSRKRVAALRCLGCQQCVVVVEEEWIGDHPSRAGVGTGGVVTWRGHHWWPLPGLAGLNDDVPDDVREAFGEGTRCLSAGAEHGAVVMFRRTLEAIIDDRGDEAAKKQRAAGGLAAALKHMSTSGQLDPSLATWATEIRLAGNTGGHFDPLQDLRPGEADDLARLCRSLLDYLYEMPAKIKRARARPSTSK